MLVYLAIFFLVITVNIVPLFMPATWTVLAYLSVTYGIPFVTISIVGAVAATLGRVILGMLSRTVLRQYFLRESTKKNMDYIRTYLESHRNVGLIFFLSYAFTPLPSSQLFIAYGLTDLKFRHLAFPFFVGRIASYLFLTFTTNKAVDYFPEEWSSTIGVYFIVVQLLTIAMVYFFAKIDWRRLITRKKVEIVH